MKNTNGTENILTDPIDFDLVINDGDIQSELADQSLLFAKWVKLSVMAAKKQQIAETVYEEALANTRDKISTADKSLKVGEVKDKATMDPHVKQLRRELIEAESLKKQYSLFVKALEMKHENLKDICANLRKELV